MLSNLEGGSPLSLGWSQKSRCRGLCAGQGAGSTATLEQAGQRAEGSCRFFGLVVGGGLPLQSLVGGRGRDSALGHRCVTALAGRSPCLLPWPLSCGQPFLLGAVPSGEPRGGREAGLGEVERFIPGEQAAGESRGCQLLEPTLASNRLSSKVEGGSFHQAEPNTHLGFPLGTI